MYFYFFFTVKEDTVFQSLCLFLFLRHDIQKTKEDILHKRGFAFIVFYSKR